MISILINTNIPLQEFNHYNLQGSAQEVLEAAKRLYPNWTSIQITVTNTREAKA